MLTAPDPADRLLLRAMTEKAILLRRQEMRSLALLIANEVWRPFRKGGAAGG